MAQCIKENLGGRDNTIHSEKRRVPHLLRSPKFGVVEASDGSKKVGRKLGREETVLL
jgi:hypothetical protein